MLSRAIGLVGISLVIAVGVTSVFALTELERVSIVEPRLEDAFGTDRGDNITVNQQIQISIDVTNLQEKSQNFVYLVQIIDEEGLVVSLGWISGQLTPDQKLSPSLSWTPETAGKFNAEIYVWEGLKNHNALTEFTVLAITVS